MEPHWHRKSAGVTKADFEMGGIAKLSRFYGKLWQQMPGQLAALLARSLVRERGRFNEYGWLRSRSLYHAVVVSHCSGAGLSSAISFKSCLESDVRRNSSHRVGT